MSKPTKTTLDESAFQISSCRKSSMVNFRGDGLRLADVKAILAKFTNLLNCSVTAFIMTSFLSFH